MIQHLGNGSDSSVFLRGDSLEKHYHPSISYNLLQRYHTYHSQVSGILRESGESRIIVPGKSMSWIVDFLLGDTPPRDITVELEVLDLSPVSIATVYDVKTQSRYFITFPPYVSGDKVDKWFMDELFEFCTNSTLLAILYLSLTGVNTRLRRVGDYTYRLTITDLGASIPKFCKKYEELQGL